MSTKADRQQVLGVLEDNYTSDLSIHLYSTFLLRRINPNFPRHSWSYWPLRFADVPIPQDNFEDDIVDGYEKDIDDDVSALKRRVSNRKSRAEEAASLEDSTKRMRTPRSTMLMLSLRVNRMRMTTIMSLKMKTRI